MSFQQSYLPTPGATPQSMDHDEPSPPTSYAHNSSTWTPVDGMTPISTNPSRKRSRDKTGFDPETDGSYFPSLLDQVNTPAPIPEEPIYGEGMVLLNPQTGMSIGAESQSGTWMEEKEDYEKLEAEIKAANFRPKFPTSRKSMRLSQSSIKTNVFDNIQMLGAPASPPRTATNPEIDDAAIYLGISWSQVSKDSEAIQSAARGWARYLDNHYSQYIHGAEIILKNSAHDAYLVKCQEGYYLFQEDLLQGQLVAQAWERCLENLRSYPFVFDGDRVQAERTPGPDLKTSDNSAVEMSNWADYNRLNNFNTTVESVSNGGMDMD